MDFGEVYIQVALRVGGEVKKSFRSHGAVPADPLRRTALVCEEAGEALKEALDMTRTGVRPEKADFHRRALKMELVQTAAMAMHVLCEMDKEDNP